MKLVYIRYTNIIREKKCKIYVVSEIFLSRNAIVASTNVFAVFEIILSHYQAYLKDYSVAHVTFYAKF